MYADHLVLRWLDCLLDALGDARVFDAHTHLGHHDPSGFSVELDELLGALDPIDGRAAVFPLSEPDGYREANRMCAEAATGSDGRLTAFVRLTPGAEAVAMLQEGLTAGAGGVKLHLSSDGFGLDDPDLYDVFEVADDCSLPVIVHAGPELDSMGRTALEVCARWPGIRLVLAHCAMPDLGWLWRHVADAPQLFFDTSWWIPAQLMALFRLVPPGRILNASDLPYSTPISHTLSTARCAWQAGLDPTQIRGVIGGQFARLVDCAEPLELGPPPAAEATPVGPLLEVISTNLVAALESMQRGHEPGVPLTAARHACRVPADDPYAPVTASVSQLLDLYHEHHESLPQRNQFLPGWDLISAAATIARTPAAPLPNPRPGRHARAKTVPGDSQS
jgi:predicted TIM-barrel fold metal-dependent hydrolase